MILTIEDVLVKIGEYGRVQKFLDFLFCILNIPVAMQILITTFTALTPPWQCKANTSCTLNGTLNAHDRRRCDLPRQSWEYTKPKEFSLVTQFDIHCKNEWQLILLSSIFFVSWGLGAIVLGWVGDKYGRKALMFPSFTIVVSVGFITAFLPNIYAIIVSRFITGFFLHGTSTQAYVLISEIVGNKQRPFACLIIFLATSVGWILLALQAYWIMNWKILTIVSSIPYIFILFFYKVVPESIQWLTLRGRKEEVIDILSKIAKWNKKELPNDVTIAPNNNDSGEQKSSIIDIFRTPKLARQSLILGYLWIAIAMGYYGLYMASNDLGGSLYRDFIILSLSDVPALFLSIYICNRFGRKVCTIYPLLIGGITCIGVAFTPIAGNYKILRIVLGNLGKMFLCLAFNGVYTWSVEIYPTNVRSSGMGFTTIAARIGSAAAPWVVKGLEPVGNWCPFFALGVPPIVGFVFGLVLPETKEEKENDTNPKKEVGLDNISSHVN